MKRCISKSVFLYIISAGFSVFSVIQDERKTWKDAVQACGKRNPIVNDFETNWIRPMTSCSDKENFTFWSGRYITLSDWIAFSGCYLLNDVGDTSNTNSVAACYQWCVSQGKFSFGLKQRSCICLENNTVAVYSTARGNHNCIRNGNEYYGIGSSLALYTFIAKPQENLTEIMCSTYYCKRSTNYHRASCNNKHMYMCDDGVISYSSVTWMEAVNACSNRETYIQGTAPVNCRNIYPNQFFWSYVKRFPLYRIFSYEDEMNLKVWKCEMVHLRNGNLSREFTKDCQHKKLPYICQSDVDHGHIILHQKNRSCSISVSTEEIFKTTKATSSESSTYTADVDKSDPVTSKPMTIKTTEQPSSYVTKQTTDQLMTSNTMGIKSTEQSTNLAITHSVERSTNGNSKTQVYIIVGVVVPFAVMIVVAIVVVIICRRKKENRPERGPSVSWTKYQHWPKTSKSISSVPNNVYQQRESVLYANNIDETVRYENTEIDLYAMTDDNEYDHLHSNRRKLKQDVGSLYDSTAQVRAEDGMYSSTTNDKESVDNNGFYDSMQNIRIDGQNMYDHTFSNCTNSEDISDSMYSTTKHM